MKGELACFDQRCSLQINTLLMSMHIGSEQMYLTLSVFYIDVAAENWCLEKLFSRSGFQAFVNLRVLTELGIFWAIFNTHKKQAHIHTVFTVHSRCPLASLFLAK